MPYTKEQRALHYQANKARIKKWHQEYYQRNREKILKSKKGSYDPVKYKERLVRIGKSPRARDKERERKLKAENYKKYRSVFLQVRLEEKNKRFVDLIRKGLALERRKVWKQLKHDLEFRYYLKIA